MHLGGGGGLYADIRSAGYILRLRSEVSTIRVSGWVQSAALP
jgi:hypothetical protein